MCEKSEELCQGRIDFFLSFFLGDNYGRQTGKYDAKNARLANQVPGFTGAQCGRNHKTASKSQ